ncbi:hypothetical protein LguiB_020932 [Lonicera macranthoides]
MDPKLLSMSPPSGEWFRDLVLQVGHSEITHATVTFPGTTLRIINEENISYKPHRHPGRNYTRRYPSRVMTITSPLLPGNSPNG